jgi:hypothetical protein
MSQERHINTDQINLKVVIGLYIIDFFMNHTLRYLDLSKYGSISSTPALTKSCLEVLCLEPNIPEHVKTT